MIAHEYSGNTGRKIEWNQNCDFLSVSNQNWSSKNN